MAELNFANRFRADSRFRDAVEKIHLEAVLESAGIDPETLNKAYEAGVRPLTLTQYRDFAKPAKKTKKAAPKKVAPVKQEEPKAEEPTE